MYMYTYWAPTTVQVASREQQSSRRKHSCTFCPQRSTMSTVRCSHLLCKHTGSRNPVSRRTGQQITMSKEEAIAELTQIMADLTPENFAEKASARSDCGSFQNGGDLGDFGRGMMQKPFEDASFALSVGEMSGIVDTDSGVHVILRTA